MIKTFVFKAREQEAIRLSLRLLVFEGGQLKHNNKKKKRKNNVFFPFVSFSDGHLPDQWLVTSALAHLGCFAMFVSIKLNKTFL